MVSLLALTGGHMGKDRIEERAYKSAWHVALMLVGLYEWRNHKSKPAKVLAAGMMAFHLDAAVADAFDTKPLSRVLLEKVTGLSDEPKKVLVKPRRTPRRVH